MHYEIIEMEFTNVEEFMLEYLEAYVLLVQSQTLSTNEVLNESVLKHHLLDGNESN